MNTGQSNTNTAKKIGRAIAVGAALVPIVALAGYGIDICLEKLGPAITKPGEVVTYTVTIGQHSYKTATGVQIADSIPDGLTFLPDQSSDECYEDGNQILCDVNELEKDSEKSVSLAFRVSDDAECGSTFTNLATVWADQHDTDESNNADEVTTTVECDEPEPTPEVKKDSGFAIYKTNNRDITRPGHEVTYTVTVENTGEVDILDLEVKDQVPNTLAILEVSDSGNVKGNTVTWSNFALDAGGEWEFTITAKVKETAQDGTSICNIATARSHDHSISDEAEDCTYVEEKEKPAPVPVTAKTGTPAAFAILATILGTSGLAYTIKKSI